MTTANKLLSAAETLALLDRLRQQMREIATRAATQERETTARLTRAQTQFDRARESHRADVATRSQVITDAAEVARRHADERFQSRKTRIARAGQSARQRKLAAVEREESNRTVEIQHDLLEADRTRDRALADAEETLAAFTALLNPELTALQQLEVNARATLAAHRPLARLVTQPPAVTPDLTGTENELLVRLRDRLQATERELARVRRLVLPMLFRFGPWWVVIPVILLVVFGLVPAWRRFDFSAVPTNVWALLGVALVAVFALRFLSCRLATPAAKAAAQALEEARKLYDGCAAAAQATHTRTQEQIRQTHVETVRNLNAAWKQVQAKARELRKTWEERIEEQAGRLHTVNQERRRQSLLRLEREQKENSARLLADAESRKRELATSHANTLAQLETDRVKNRRGVESDWQTQVLPAFEQLRALREAADALFPPWRAELWEAFALPQEFRHAARFGELTVELEKFIGVPVAAGILPAVESGFQPGVKNLAATEPLEFSAATPDAQSPPGGRMPPSTAGKMPAATTTAIPDTLTVPLLLTVPEAASLLIEAKSSGHEQVIGLLNNVILRLLTSSPPGRVAFTIFDPVGLGQNFAGIMHLADYEERVISSRIWTQQAQFEQRLAELNEHIEKVTQMYLRNEYASLTEYNAQAGRLAEKYHFLVVADFPVNFSDVAVKRLQSLAASGPRCGVHLLLHWDQRKPAPVEFVPDELRKSALRLVPKGEGFAVAGHTTDSGGSRGEEARSDSGGESQSLLPSAATMSWEGVQLTLDAPPDAELATRLLHHIGQASTDSYRVEMPFAEVVPTENEIWSLDTTNELRVPIGRTGATKLQYLALGQGTRQHGLVAGKTGSGKSTLFHVIVTNLSLWCRPEQVEFYLVDFKKGVEFKCYATHKLPHARVIAIESDREFGLSVLQRVDDELRRRGDLFRKLGAQDLAGYKRFAEEAARSRRREEADGASSFTASPPPHVGGYELLPRVLLLIDEFQEFFVEDDRISQGAALLLDRIVRQGRAFGIHVLLGSQTLGGAYTLARATIGQMVVRVALQCNEADAYLIMNEDNPAPRLLSRPGEAIYNDTGGSIEGNSPFQVVWLPDQVRDEWLGKVRAEAERRSPTRLVSADATQRAATEVIVSREPIVFEGNAPAHVADNAELRTLLATAPPQSPAAARVFLGAPNSIKGPTEAVFRRASGNHLLIVGQRDEAALGMLAMAMISLAAQYPRAAARFFVFDCSAPDAPEARYLERVVTLLPHATRLVRPGEVEEVMAALAAEQQQRAEHPGESGPETFLLIHRLPQNKKLRFDEEMSFSLDANAEANPGLQLNKLICEGASLGLHAIATCDTYNNVMRMLSRKALSEFELRVVFQMSAGDSASLIESPAANNLGLHRALLHNGQEGWTETFRPYALPDTAWLVESLEKLAKREQLR